MEIFENIVWTFSGKYYDSYEKFEIDINQYQIDILGKNAVWSPKSIVVDSPSVEIVYEYFESETDSKFDDEENIDLGNETNADDDMHDEEKKIVKALFYADNKQFFTFGELLFKIHQRLTDRDLGDDIYFEGLTSIKDSHKLDPPSWFLLRGS